MAKVHPTAIVSGAAQVASDAEIGPGCVVGEGVTVGAGARLIGNVYVDGPARIGDGTIVYPFACIGYPPQDFKFPPGSPTAGVVIGDGCVIREYATVHAATGVERPTSLGARVMMMVNSHVGHDAVLEDDVILVNGVALGGHVRVGARANFGGGAVVQQHTRIGRLAFVSGVSGISGDVPPFCMVATRNVYIGPNVVGLRRAGIPGEDINMVRRACRDAFRERIPKSEMIERLRNVSADHPLVLEMVEFVRSSKHSICTGAGPQVLRGREQPVA